MTTMRAVAYCRVSSTGQRDRHTIESQLISLPALVARHGWTLVRPIGHYVDDGRTARAGHLGDREAFTRLLRDAAAGEFDVVAVVDLDRLTRSEDLAERGAVLGAFQRAGVQIAVASSGQVLDLSSAAGDLFSTLGAFFAAEENRKRRERTVAGKSLAISRGRKPAGPTPYGYLYDRATGVWSINADEAEIVREIYRRVAAGESCMVLARDFAERGVPRKRGGEWVRERVWQIARARTYVGEWTADRQLRRVVPVPPIVDEVAYEAVQEALERHRKRGLRRTRHVYLLEGIATCAVCGGRVSIASATASRTRTPAPARYVCSHRLRPRHGATPCPLPYMRTAEVDDRVWTALVRLLSREDIVGQALAHNADVADDRAKWEEDLAEARRRLERLQRAEAAVLARARRGLVSDAAVDAELRAISRERAMLDQQVAAAERALAAGRRNEVRVEDARRALEAARESLAAASPAARQHVIRALLEPGSVVAGADGEVVATVRLAAGCVSGDASSTSSERQTHVRVRLVA
jgi:site-specific DNA recombinase